MRSSLLPRKNTHYHYDCAGYDITIRTHPVFVSVTVSNERYLSYVYHLFSMIVKLTSVDDSDRCTMKIDHNTYTIKAPELHIDINTLVNGFHHAEYTNFPELQKILSKRISHIRSPFLDALSSAIEVNNTIIRDFWCHVGKGDIRDVVGKSELEILSGIKNFIRTATEEVLLSYISVTQFNLLVEDWKAICNESIDKLRELGRYTGFINKWPGYIHDDARAWIRKEALKRRDRFIKSMSFRLDVSEYLSLLKKEIKFQQAALDAYNGKI